MTDKTHRTPGTTIDDTVNRMMLDGWDFMNAGCMVASWEIARCLLGPDDGTMERDAIEVEIQEILHRVFGGGEMAS